MRRLLSLWMFALAFVALPSVAKADLKLAGRPRLARGETHARQGISPRMGVRSGMAIVPNGFVPTIAVDWGFFGGITDRFTLGVQASLIGYLGLKAGGGADIVAERFFGRGFYLHAALGAQGNLPARAADVQRAGVGGFGGLGYEFRIFERMALALGVDYDARVRTDGLYSQMVLMGVNFRGYIHKK